MGPHIVVQYEAVTDHIGNRTPLVGSHFPVFVWSVNLSTIY